MLALVVMKVPQLSMLIARMHEYTLLATHAFSYLHKFKEIAKLVARNCAFDT